MAQQLTDKLKKAILADFAETGNKSATARKFGVSGSTVFNVVKENPDTMKIIAEKQTQNTMDVLAFMDAKRDKACKFLDMALEAMSDPEKLKGERVRDIATAFGIIVDKFTVTAKGENDVSLFMSIAKAAQGGMADDNLES